MAAAGGGIWTAFSPTGSGFATQKVSYTNGYFVSVRYTGSFVKSVWVSTDGITWTDYSSFWTSIVGGPMSPPVYGAGTGTYAFPGYYATTQEVYYEQTSFSSSPQTYAIASGGSGGIQKITYTNGIFVAALGTYSINGVSSYPPLSGPFWTLNSAPGAGAESRIYHNGTVYVCVGLNGLAGAAWTSPDLNTWTKYTSGLLDPLVDLIWTGTYFVAVGSAGGVYTSTDGATWTKRTTTITQDLNIVNYVGSTVFASGRTGVIIRSTDGGVTWGNNELGGLSPSGFYPIQSLAVGPNRAIVTVANTQYYWTTTY